MDIVYQPIGYIHTPFHTDEETPNYFLADTESEATLVMDEKYLGCMADMAPGERYMVIFHLDRARPYKERVTTRSPDRAERCLFSTHAPDRPNPIGVSVITVRRVEGNKITFTGVDMFDNTPVLDLKSYRPAYAAD